MIYEFHPEAEQEFIEAAAFYERNVTGLGERFGNEVMFHHLPRCMEIRGHAITKSYS